MERAPQPELPEQVENEAELRRKRRFFDRLRGWQHRKSEVLSEEPAEEAGISELWQRTGDGLAAETEETELSLETSEFRGRLLRLQHVGRVVVARAHDVSGFAESVAERIEGLPAEDRQHVAGEAVRLGEATGELTEAADELDAELDELDNALEETPENQAYPVAAANPEAARKPEKPVDKPEGSGVGGMARLVIATLVGGGLGALVGAGEERAKNRKAAKEKAKDGAAAEQQKQKLAAQEAELQALKAQKVEAGSPAEQKEYVKQTSELAEKQTDITRNTTEQVRAAVHQTAEQDRTYQIPEQRPAQSERLATTETAEHLNNASAEKPEAKNNNQSGKSEATGYVPAHQQQPNPAPHVIQGFAAPSAQPKKQVTVHRTYAVLLAIAVIITLGLLLFGSK